jgi:hypothetical protein
VKTFSQIPTEGAARGETGDREGLSGGGCVLAMTGNGTNDEGFAQAKSVSQMGTGAESYASQFPDTYTQSHRWEQISAPHGAAGQFGASLRSPRRPIRPKAWTFSGGRLASRRGTEIARSFPLVHVHHASRDLVLVRNMSAEFLCS